MSPRRSWRARLSGHAVLVLGLVLAGTAYTLVASPSSAEESPAAQSSLAVEEGRRLYLLGCSTCHGLDLQGAQGGPSLIGVGESAVVFQVESGRMPLAAGTAQAPAKRPRYSRAEVDQLAAYIHQAGGGGPELPEGDLTDGDLQQGGNLFRTNCASCHNFAGAGGALTYGKQAPPLTDSSPRVIYTAMQSGPESMPRFGDAQLTVEEKKAITRYVTYLNQADDPGGAALGRFGPVAEGLAVWVLGISALIGLTLWIGARA